MDASVRVKETALHVVEECGLRHMGSQGSLLFVACALERREASCLIGWKADGNSRKSTTKRTSGHPPALSWPQRGVRTVLG